MKYDTSTRKNLLLEKIELKYFSAGGLINFGRGDDEETSRIHFPRTMVRQR